VCRVVTFLLVVLAACCAHAAALIPCPDCEQTVSPRAVMCPHCGCPGEAIAETVALAEEEAAEPTLGPVFCVTASAGSGYGVGMIASGLQYLIMDARLLWEADSLTVTAPGTNDPIAYRGLQTAKDVPLARFRTDATNLTFLAVARTAAPAGKTFQWMFPCSDAEGSLVLVAAGADPSSVPAHRGHPSPLALVDAHTNLVGVAFQVAGGGYSHALPSEDEWQDTAPALFRAQTRLLAKAERESKAGRLTLDTGQALSSTEWLTGPLQKRADLIFQQRGKEQTP